MRLLNWEIDYKSSSKDRTEGRIRRITNLNATESITIHTLRHHLEVTELT